MPRYDGPRSRKEVFRPRYAGPRSREGGTPRGDESSLRSGEEGHHEAMSLLSGPGRKDTTRR